MIHTLNSAQMQKTKETTSTKPSVKKNAPQQLWLAISATEHHLVAKGQFTLSSKDASVSASWIHNHVCRAPEFIWSSSLRGPTQQFFSSHFISFHFFHFPFTLSKCSIMPLVCDLQRQQRARLVVFFWVRHARGGGHSEGGRKAWWPDGRRQHRPSVVCVFSLVRCHKTAVACQNTQGCPRAGGQARESTSAAPQPAGRKPACLAESRNNRSSVWRRGPDLLAGLPFFFFLYTGRLHNRACHHQP